jgi:tRNA pseudouridine38-40 synthase
MRRLKLTLAYDGTSFVGWQRQAAGTSIQGLLEEILSDIDGQPVDVAGAGRTDAGVHALGQVASAGVQTALDVETLQRALNARLPAEVRVLEVADAASDFHARFSARGKHYRYLIAHGPVLSPFASRYVWHVPGASLDLRAMASALSGLVGTHDFSSFQSTGTAVPHAIRTITEAMVTDVTSDPPPPLGGDVAPAGRLLAVELAADGFLRHMVRAIAGTLVEVGAGRRARDLTDLIFSKDRAAAGPTAPAHGLWLVRVVY